MLKDIWGLDGEQRRAVALWAAHALVRAAMAEAAATRSEGAELAERAKTSELRRRSPNQRQHRADREGQVDCVPREEDE